MWVESDSIKAEGAGEVVEIGEFFLYIVISNITVLREDLNGLFWEFALLIEGPIGLGEVPGESKPYLLYHVVLLNIYEAVSEFNLQSVLLPLSLDLSQLVDLGHDLHVLPFRIHQVRVGLQFLELCLRLLEHLLHALLEQLDLDLWNVDHLDVIEDFTASHAVYQNSQQNHPCHVKSSQLSESDGVVRIDSNHHRQRKAKTSLQPAIDEDNKLFFGKPISSTF